MPLILRGLDELLEGNVALGRLSDHLSASLEIFSEPLRLHEVRLHGATVENGGHLGH